LLGRCQMKLELILALSAVSTHETDRVS
jgi:hypothetical protein